eukprot:735161-Alexandrium_andersonii.AAC.1
MVQAAAELVVPMAAFSFRRDGRPARGVLLLLLAWPRKGRGVAPAQPSIGIWAPAGTAATIQ